MGKSLKKPFFWRCSKTQLAKNREICIVCSDYLSQSSGRGQLSREGARDVRESREQRDKIVPILSPENNRKNAILAWFFPLFWAGSLVVRESRHRHDKISEKNSAEKEEKTFLGLRFFFKKWACASRYEEFHLFFWPRKNKLFLGGGITSTLVISQWPSWGIYKHARPSFGAKDVCYI